MKSKKWWTVTVTVLVAILCAAFFYDPYQSDPYATFEDPSGEYVLKVYSEKPAFFGLAMMFPGQGGDVPAKAVLRTSKGKYVGKAYVEMAQQMDQPEWGSDSVYVKLVMNIQYDKVRKSGDKEMK